MEAKDTIYEGRPQNEKLDLLRANCKSSEFQDVKIFFSEEDLAEMKTRLSEVSIDRDAFEDELRELSKGLREKIKASTNTFKILLVHLKNKFEYQSQEVFDFDDQEQGLMLTYNNQGELINSRKLRPQEKQTRIVNLNQKSA